MENDILFSIIIPAYNEENYLPACLDSVKAQKGGFNYEIIVVDSKSTDKTAELAGQAGVRVARAGFGVGRARQEGTALARGKYIVHLDADSRPPDDYLIEIKKRFDRDSALVNVGGRVIFYDAPLWKNILRFVLQYPLWIFARLVSRGQIGPMGNNMVFKKFFYDQVDGFNPELKFGEDADLSRQLRKFGKVKLDMSLKCYASARRYKISSHLFTLFINFIKICVSGAPFKNELEHSSKL